MLSVTSSEQRPLKRQKLGPPDVYPQDAKQREDELNDQSVKMGFTHKPTIKDEYGSALHAQFLLPKIANSFNAILKKRTDILLLPDTGRKKQQINIKDNFWLVIPRSKAALEVWFKDLAGSKPLSSLVKKVPIFPKKEEMLLTLCEYSVPYFRAAWFIKMFSFYHESKMAESKMKRRPPPDLSQEWTQTITRFLKEHLGKIADVYMGPPNYSGMSGSAGSTPTGGSTPSHAPQCSPLHGNSASSITGSSGGVSHQISEYLRNWNYCTQLALHMYQDGLLDRQEFLDWIVDIVSRQKQSDQDPILRIVISLPLQYLDQITQTECLSRKLAYFSAMKLRQLSESPYECNKSPTSQTNPPSTPSNAFQEHMQCFQHRPIVLGLSCFMQAITLDCPTAMVWNMWYEGKGPKWLMGSPLDILHCAPSELPMPPKNDNECTKKQLKIMEEHTRIRSRAAENRWSLERSCANVNGTKIAKVLSVLEALDTHCFKQCDTINSLDILYAKIFVPTKDAMPENITSPGGTNANNSFEDAIVHTLCKWAVSVQRSGEYRSLVVARLLEKRQNEVTASEVEGDDKEVSNPYVFQDLLLQFLDTQAPVYDENSLSVRSQEFGNLVLLFSELIRQDVFSHDSYMCTLISRGDLAAVNDSKQANCLFSKRKEEGTDNIDADLDKIIQDITKEAGAPDSPKDDVNTSLEDQAGSSRTERVPGTKNRLPRHLIYAQHFPLPSDDGFNHEMNQRYVLLYGVGKARDEARHSVKKLSKEILKLFSKKFSIDIADGGKVKRSLKGEFNFESIYSKFKALSYFDQHLITNQVSSQVLEMLSGCGSGSFNHLPMLDHIAFLMDLMELAQNVQGLLDFCTQTLKEIVDIELQLVERQCLVGTYTPQLTLHVVGVLRKYHCCLLISQEQTAAVFEGLCRLVKHVTNPSDCTSPERVVLAHLHELYTNCAYLKNKHHDSFSNAFPKIKQTMFTTIVMSKPAIKWAPNFMEEYLKNPKLKIEPNVVKQLNDPSNRFSFACNAILEACSPISNEKLNDLAILCVELTACCNGLSHEWLRLLGVICCSSVSNPEYSEFLNRIDLKDPRSAPLIHSSLAVLTTMFLARFCFQITDFLNQVVFQSLKSAWNNGKGNTEAEPGARLTCHLILRIFKSVESPQPSQYSGGSPQNVAGGIGQRTLKTTCDRNLLAAVAHTSFNMEPVLAVLKAMLIVSDAMSLQNKGIAASLSDILGTSDAGGSNDSDMMGKGGDKACLADFARYALRQICSQEWVRESCLKNPKDLCSKDNLLDRLLSAKQAQRLLYLICNPDNPSSLSDQHLERHQTLSSIFEDLDEWTLRISWLDLKLMYEQHRVAPATQQSQQELNTWLDNVAHAVILVFQQNNESELKHKNSKSRSICLVAPLVAKLPKAVQMKVLKVAIDALGAVNFSSFGCKSSNQQMSLRMPGSSQSSSQQTPNAQVSTLKLQFPVSAHRPFLQLLLMCLKEQDENVVSLVESVKDQLNQAVTLYKEEKGNQIEDAKVRQQILEALRLRFALVGSLFDSIIQLCSCSVIAEWAVLLVHLVMYGVVDLSNNSELFTNLLDMLTAFIHTTLLTDVTAENREESRRSLSGSSIVRKIKKELVDSNSVSLRLIRQLVPFSKVQTEVITLDPWGTVTDTKGNRLQDFEKDKKHGLQVSEKQKLAPWDLLDGQRNPAPLSWVWFAASKLERKPLKYEESHRLQRYHQHFAVKPTSYFLEPIQLPPEDLEPTQDKNMLSMDMPIKEEVKAPDTPTDQSPRGVAKRGGKINKARRVRNPRQPTVPNMGPGATMQPMNYPNANFNQAGGQSQWPGGFQQHQPTQPQPNQSQYCHQQLPPAGGPRYGPTASQGRNAVRSFLMHRGPSQPNFPIGAMNNMGRQTSIMRQTPIRGPMQGTMQNSMHGYNSNNNMQGGISSIPGQTGQMYNSVGPSGMGPQSSSVGNQGMGQFNSYQQNPMSGGQMMSQGPGGNGTGGGPGLMGQGYQQGYQGNPTMLSIRQQQPYINQSMGQNQMVQRSQYMGGPTANSGMTMMNSSQPYNRTGIQPMNQNSASNILRQRVAMGPNNPGQGAPGGQGSMIGHIPRPMTGMGQNQAQSQQGTQPNNQQMMHGTSQQMGYPQGPNY